jgi:hypothetical protein
MRYSLRTVSEKHEQRGLGSVTHGMMKVGEAHQVEEEILLVTRALSGKRLEKPKDSSLGWMEYLDWV